MATKGSKNPAAQSLGHLGGERRDKVLSSHRKLEIARAAALARWHKKKGKTKRKAEAAAADAKT